MDARPRYLITGRDGQLVRSLLEVGLRSKGKEAALIALGRPALDLTDHASVKSAISKLGPDLVVSAAAYTAVDQAESHEEIAWQVNANGPLALAEAAAARGIPLIHMSTDYVFDGTKNAPYDETDTVAPLGVYGRTKLEGERLALAAYDNVAILRTAWVYSPFGKNFAKTMLRAASSRSVLNVVDDQLGNPSSALDLAAGILSVARNLITDPDPGLRGVFHMTGRGDATWAEFAEEIFRVSAANGGPCAEVSRISTAEYPTPAMRPANSRLNNGALERAHRVVLPQWQTSTKTVVERLVENKEYQ